MAGTLLIGILPSTGYSLALVGMAIVGIVVPLVDGPFLAIIQSIVPNEMQGRVLTVLMSISDESYHPVRQLVRERLGGKTLC